MANKYTVQESNNLAIGQGRSMFLNEVSSDGSNTMTPPSNTVFIAIQCINDTKFTQLIADNNLNCFGTDGVDNTHAGGVGDRIPATAVFPAGTVLYGRWNLIELTQGIVVAYCGG